MNRLLFCFLALVSLMANANPDNYGRKDIIVDGIKYAILIEKQEWETVDQGTPVYAAVVANKDNKYSGDIVIQNTVGGCPVVLIASDAFSGCDQISTISIPANIRSFGGASSESAVNPYESFDSYSSIYPFYSINPFLDCTNLRSIKIDADNKSYDSRDDCNAIIETKSNKLLFGIETTTIPNTVTTIGNSSFKNCIGLSSIVVPNSVTKIEDSAFSGCINLTTISFLGDVPFIGERAFEGCSSLSSITLPNGLSKIPAYAFNDCISLNSITIPEDVEKICTGAFKGCYALHDIYCNTHCAPSLETKDPTWDTEIEDPFFDVIIDNIILHVKDYDVEMFLYLGEPWCNMKKVVDEKVTDFNLTYYVDGEEYKKEQYKYDDEITPLVEPTKDGYTFSGWSEIPEKMPGKDVRVDGKFMSNEVKEGGAIYHVFNERAAVIGNDNAAGDVKIASSVTFNEKSVPVTDIVDFSFKNNTDITSVVIPESVIKIGDEAFYGCKNLTKIELGKSVNQIEPRAFAGIDKLTDVTCYAEDLVPDADRTAFENSYTEDYVTLHVPAGSIEKYKAVAPWKNFKEIVAIDGTEETKDEDPAKDEENDDATEDVITLKDSGKGTWCSENDLDFTDLEDIKAYIASGYDDIKKTIWLTRVYSVPAGTGIMVKGTPGEHKIPYAKVRAYYANMFKGVVGSAVKIESTDGDWTNYYMAGGQFKIVNGSTTINPNRCYLQLPTLVFAGTRSVDVVYEDEIDDKTGINPSFVTNDQEPAVIYNLQGQRVENPRKGVYIRNGKKIIIK